jgi:hypothetical protein
MGKMHPGSTRTRDAGGAKLGASVQWWSTDGGPLGRPLDGGPLGRPYNGDIPAQWWTGGGGPLAVDR